jgi:hypothetical protein
MPLYQARHVHHGISLRHTGQDPGVCQVDKQIGLW